MSRLAGPGCIRRATPDDTPVVVKGINAICAEGRVFDASHFIPTPPWEAVLHQPETVPGHLLAVAELGGRFAGAARLFPGEQDTFSRHVAELGMFVLKPYRRRGLGRELLAWVLAWAAEAGLEKVTLSVFAANEPALQLYRRFGFVEEGCQRRQIKIGNQYIDLLWLACFVQGAGYDSRRTA